eukprot:scaffold272299_cov37-Tisochrysis_lutea.AAC.3
MQRSGTVQPGERGYTRCQPGEHRAHLGIAHRRVAPIELLHQDSELSITLALNEERLGQRAPGCKQPLRVSALVEPRLDLVRVLLAPVADRAALAWHADPLGDEWRSACDAEL